MGSEETYPIGEKNTPGPILAQSSGTPPPGNVNTSDGRPSSHHSHPISRPFRGQHRQSVQVVPILSFANRGLDGITDICGLGTAVACQNTEAIYTITPQFDPHQNPATNFRTRTPKALATFTRLSTVGDSFPLSIRLMNTVERSAFSANFS